MVLGIPDIRLFWSEDERFIAQFRDIDANATNSLPSLSNQIPEC